MLVNRALNKLEAFSINDRVELRYIVEKQEHHKKHTLVIYEKF